MQTINHEQGTTRASSRRPLPRRSQLTLRLVVMQRVRIQVDPSGRSLLLRLVGCENKQVKEVYRLFGRCLFVQASHGKLVFCRHRCKIIFKMICIYGLAATIVCGGCRAWDMMRMRKTFVWPVIDGVEHIEYRTRPDMPNVARSWHLAFATARSGSFAACFLQLFLAVAKWGCIGGPEGFRSSATVLQHANWWHGSSAGKA